MKVIARNYLNQIVGEIEVPDGTPQHIIDERLAAIAKPPPTPQEVAANNLSATILDRKNYSEAMLERFKKRNMTASPPINIAQAMWMHHKMRAIQVVFMHPVLTGGEVVNMTLDILNLAIPGDIEVACIALQCIPASGLDDMTKPYHFFNAAARDWIVADMKSYLGWS
jgi:hypothetical protein